MKSDRIHLFRSTPIVNLIVGDDGVLGAYRKWMIIPLDIREPSVKRAKRILGPQDYCWQGNCRCWIWEGEFQVVLNGLPQERHWRLFASSRGIQLEIEIHDPKEAWEKTQACVEIGRAGLEAFLKVWEAKS